MARASAVQRAGLAYARTVRDGNPAEIERTRHELAEVRVRTARERAEARIAEAIRAVVEDAPPLTPAQRDRLAALLAGNGQAES